MRWFLIILVVGSLACTGSTPSPALPSLDEPRATQVGRYLVSLDLEPDPPKLGELFQVQARVTLPDGRPVETAKVVVDARMPQHEHGMETRPRLREGVCDGAANLGAEAPSSSLEASESTDVDDGAHASSAARTTDPAADRDAPVRQGATDASPDDAEASGRPCRHADGRYIFDGFKFHMAGQWTMLVQIDGPAGPDSTSMRYLAR